MTYGDKLTRNDVYKAIKFDRDFHVLVRTALGETRGGSPANAKNVIFTVLNRVRKQREAWGKNIWEVCFMPKQYSYWDATGLDYLSYYYVKATIIPAIEAIEDWRHGKDPTNGATHYHTHEILPGWAKGHKTCFEDDMHKFYNNVY